MSGEGIRTLDPNLGEVVPTPELRPLNFYLYSNKLSKQITTSIFIILLLKYYKEILDCFNIL